MSNITRRVIITLVSLCFLVLNACSEIFPVPGDNYNATEEARRIEERYRDNLGQENTAVDQPVPTEEIYTPYGKDEIYGDNETLSIGMFWLRHPFIASEIGEPKVNVGNTNISTNAMRFSRAFDFKDSDNSEGTQANALRHAIWMATITNKWGKDIALQVGNAHEENPNALMGLDIYDHKFNSLSATDEAIDLLNNIIGREIGGNITDNSTMKNITKVALNYYHTNGLHIAKESADGFVITLEKIQEEQYKRALETLETLDENGFPPGDKYYNKK